MPKLQITNVGLATVMVQDFEGYTNFVMEVETGETGTRDVTRNLLQRLAPKLKELEGETKDELGVVLTGIRWSVIASDDEDDRAAGEGLAGLPSLNELQLAGISTGTPDAAAVATGTGLLGNQAKASLAIVEGAVQLDIEAVVPGAAGNAITVAITIGASLDVTVVANAISIELPAIGDAVSDIVSAINGDADALLLVQASEGAAGDLTVAAAAANLEGGTGPGVSLSVNGTALALSEVTDTQLTFAVPGGISTSGYIVPLEFQNGPHKTRLSVPVIA